MIRLFSNFDSNNFNYIMMLIIILAYLPISFKTGTAQNLIKFLVKNFFRSFYSVNNKKWTLNLMPFLYSFIIYIFILNFTSLYSYNFTPTSQLRIVFYLRFMIWRAINIFNLKNNFYNFIIHTIPEGTPLYLAWFIFVIEVIRNSIRPITLTVRLIANIMAGHLLINLTCQIVILSNITLIPIMLILINIEMWISLIQSYILITLLILFYSEI